MAVNRDLKARLARLERLVAIERPSAPRFVIGTYDDPAECCWVGLLERGVSRSLAGDDAARGGRRIAHELPAIQFCYRRQRGRGKWNRERLNSTTPNGDLALSGASMVSPGFFT
jgi:hypothetical protein